ncbi:septum formation inhibitor Maf [Campylobacter cuniculorum]|uniref:Septum formation protein Maf n=2 Tax=Campylobacter cuniculorum TaxID=374106 RepID=A0A1W6BUR7_9BACT|nr:septum formation inhibitor Maf [Campylobacter cuniculorum]ARJ55811.1 septum formation protein Maf [Campylobacter cuniculorum DSM 23162 = LMG 24588]QOR05027.1 septum formation inhibitor Maf [Campylobacter cuniculorum]
MLYLISSSSSRANLLQNARLAFKQIKFDFDENFDKNIPASLYVQRVVLEKERQFCEKMSLDFKDKTLLFADSIVCVKEQILTKARNKEEAYKMLDLQSNQSVNILSAFILKSPQKQIFSLSKTTLFFKEFEPKDVENYVENDFYKGKAGAISCESFHKKYIINRIGNLDTALGLDTLTLKAYL